MVSVRGGRFFWKGKNSSGGLDEMGPRGVGAATKRKISGGGGASRGGEGRKHCELNPDDGKGCPHTRKTRFLGRALGGKMYGAGLGVVMKEAEKVYQAPKGQRGGRKKRSPGCSRTPRG